MFIKIEKRESLSKKIAAEIEDAIQNRLIPAGAKLPSETELAVQFNVSRPTIREAIKTLTARGIISVQTGKGLFAAGVSSEHVSIPMHDYLRYQSGSESIIDLIDARMIIEPGVAEFAAINRTDIDVQILKKDLMNLIESGNDPEEQAGYDMIFHFHLAEATHNFLVALIMKPIFDLLPKLKVHVIKSLPNAIESAKQWHQLIFDAVERRDSKLARQCMIEHLTVAKEHSLSVINNK